jgi:hypothetical protein
VKRAGAFRPAEQTKGKPKDSKKIKGKKKTFCFFTREKGLFLNPYRI